MPPRVFFALLLALGGAMMAGAQHDLRLKNSQTISQQSKK